MRTGSTLQGALPSGVSFPGIARINGSAAFPSSAHPGEASEPQRHEQRGGGLGDGRDGENCVGPNAVIGICSNIQVKEAF